MVKNYTLVVLFGLMIATCVRDERSLYMLVTAFLVVLAIYMLHSISGIQRRHTFGMGIARMVGVDKSLGDPKFVRRIDRLLVAVFDISLALLANQMAASGDRLVLAHVGRLHPAHWIAIIAFGRRRVGFAARDANSAQNRDLGRVVRPCCRQLVCFAGEFAESIQTIIDPSVGPANAQESGQGRIDGFFIGMKLWPTTR